MKVPHYIELKVKHGWRRRRVGFLFDMYSWMLLFEKYGVNLGGLKGKDPQEMVQMMLYTSAISARKDAGKKVWFTEADVQRWWNRMTNAETAELGKVFTESMKVFEKFGKEATDDKKKES